jgi:pimeloyl-ACP methyl ester carboxylesterase
MNKLSQLAYQASGPEDAQSIVFLHGGGVGSWMWNPVIGLLSDYRCIAPDQPEHGGSRRIGKFNIELAAEKVADLIHEQTRRGKATIVGLSEGAQIAVQVLASTPEVVEKAIVSSALLFPVPGLGWAKSPSLLSWLYRVSVPPFRNNDWWIRLNMKRAAGIPDEYYSSFKKDFQETTESEFVNLMISNQNFRLPSGLDRAVPPTLVLAGKKEYAAMKKSMQILVAALPNSRGAFINLGRGSSMAQEHNWALTSPQLFAATTRAWIENQPLPAEIESYQK